MSTDFDSRIGLCNNYFVIGHTTPRDDVRGRPFIKNINWWKWSQRASDSLRRSLTSLFEWPRLRPWVGCALLRRCDMRNVKTELAARGVLVCRSKDQVARRLRFRAFVAILNMLLRHRHHHTFLTKKTKENGRVSCVRLSIRYPAVCVGVGEQARGSCISALQKLLFTYVSSRNVHTARSN